MQCFFIQSQWCSAIIETTVIRNSGWNTKYARLQADDRKSLSAGKRNQVLHLACMQLQFRTKLLQLQTTVEAQSILTWQCRLLRERDKENHLICMTGVHAKQVRRRCLPQTISWRNFVSVCLEGQSACQIHLPKGL